MYSELEPDYCHIIFPCFDQPNLKATHKSFIIAPEEWEVISNAQNLAKSAPAASTSEAPLAEALAKAQVAPDSPIVTSFSGAKVKAHEFDRTARISTYLFSWVIGPFDCLEMSEERAAELPQVPMRIYCRKSLTKYAELIKDDWFRVTKAATRFYE